MMNILAYKVSTARGEGHVGVRTPNPTSLTSLLRAAGATVIANTEKSENKDDLQVSGLNVTAIGDIAAQHGIAIHGLTPHTASLEAAYMKLTRDHLDFHTDKAAINRSATKPGCTVPVGDRVLLSVP